MASRDELSELTDRWRRRHDARRPPLDERPAADPEREALAARAFPFGLGRPGRVRGRARLRHDRLHLRRSPLRRPGARRVAARGRPPAAGAPMTAPAWALLPGGRRSAPMPASRQPRLGWRRRAGAHSTGVDPARRDGIVAVRAGTDALDQRLTLLHELAHWLSPPPVGAGGARVHHGRAFYDVAFELYRRHGLERRRRAAPRVRSLPELAAPRGRAGRARRRRRAGGASVRPPLAPTSSVARPRPGAPGSGSSETAAGPCAPPAVSGWSGINLARIRRARRPVRHVLMTAEPPRRTSAATRSRARARGLAQLAHRRPAVRGKTWAMRWLRAERRVAGQRIGDLVEACRGWRASGASAAAPSKATKMPTVISSVAGSRPAASSAAWRFASRSRSSSASSGWPYQAAFH